MSDLPPHVPYATPETTNDAEHLRLLSLFHYICGGLIALFSSFAIIHMVMGIVMITKPSVFVNQPGAQPPPAFIGYLFAILGGSVVLLGWTIGVLTILSGRYIKQRRAWMFSMIIAGIMCLWMPFGTILGVFTFLVLLRPSVKDQYAQHKQFAESGA